MVIKIHSFPSAILNLHIHKFSERRSLVEMEMQKDIHKQALVFQTFKKYDHNNELIHIMLKLLVW